MFRSSLCHLLAVGSHRLCCVGISFPICKVQMIIIVPNSQVCLKELGLLKMVNIDMVIP